MEFDRELPFSPVCLSDALAPFPPIPTELILVILELACVDGGRTAYAVCLVSKHFYALAKPLLFYSVAVCGIDQIDAFSDRLSLVQRAPAIYVRHLFISEREIPYDWNDSRVSFMDMPVEVGWRSHRIIEAVAPFLETLCYLPFNGWRNNDILQTDIPFPRLRELVISSYQAPLMASIPLLERLHMRTRYPSESLQHLGQLYPRLTYLKVSGFEDGGGCLIHELKRSWGIPSTWEEKENLAFCLPPLRRIVLQHAPLPLDAWYPENQIEQGRARMKELVELAESELAVGLSVEEPIYAERELGQLKLAWLSRLDGGQGCWGVRRPQRSID
ncbi:hypothetical protein BOTBODRAFT_30079 [Botryobasidium botryosum FD-172 SS1]|uniref:F-box domain-containing protein n=1 Tax=Botryobasidium botryosum (strain FD-172 SS1) TaxID=930990 RepID=A0A067MRD0_BOTB1|nr:hypothetical protein BOTBODRAFT_30079 [Botryobasidium botryosum FD-172 SS1]